MRTGVLWGCGGVAIVLALGASSLVLKSKDRSSEARAEAARNEVGSEDQADRVTIKTIRPKSDPSFAISVTQLAIVEPYFQADLRARVAGPVRFIRKDIGDRVAKGELIVRIDAPDLIETVAQKNAIVAQRQKELARAVAQVKSAVEAVNVARSNIDLKSGEVFVAVANKAYQTIRYGRYVVLLAKTAVDADVVDEEKKRLDSAIAGLNVANFAVTKARADYEETRAGVEIAEAEVDLKQALVDVARRDRDLAQVFADFSKITAPFNGVITHRKVDPGDFVQNSTTAQTEPLVSVARTDIVTVVMRIPDNDAPFVTDDTEAIITLDNLAGTEMKGKVTRFARAIRGEDRTMRVEMDLFNGTEEEYQAFKLRGIGILLAPLSANLAVSSASMLVGRRYQWGEYVKYGPTSYPLLPKVTKGLPLSKERRLLPGMSGYMRLQLRKFKNAYLLPSSAVFSRGGKNFIVVVENGKARIVEVRVEVNDGSLAKVVKVVYRNNRADFEPLSGLEQVVASRQSEITDGEELTATDEEWKR